MDEVGCAIAEQGLEKTETNCQSSSESGLSIVCLCFQ